MTSPPGPASRHDRAKGPASRQRPPNTLMRMDTDQRDMVLGHPRNQWAHKTVVDLIYRLRASQADPDLFETQQALLDAVLDVEQRRAAISRVRKRVRRNSRDVPRDAPELESGLDPKDPQSWELEYLAHERVCRQLRSVGDALAWKAFGYERSFILALSRGKPSGPIAGQDGLRAELDFVDRCRRDGARMVLLHDLTNILLLGDVSVFSDDAVSFHEIKTNDKYQNSTQWTRLSATADSLIRGAPLLRGGQVLVPMTVPYRTHLDDLRNVLNLAHEHGMHGGQIPGGRAVVAASLHTAPSRWTQDEFAPEFDRRLRGLWSDIGIRTDDHKVVLASLDRAGRIPTAPPWAIYPLAPEVAAGLIMDTIFFLTSMSPEAVIAALAGQGMLAEWLQRLDGSESASEPLLSVVLPTGHGRAQTTSMNLVELNRLMLELVDLDVWSQHLAALLREQRDGIAPWPHFPDEYEVWA